MAILDVCTGGSCTYTTIAAAITAAAATDIIELRGDITENVALNKNVAEIRGDGNRTRTWTATSGGGTNATFKIQSGLNQAFTLRDLNVTKSGGVADCINLNTSGASQTLTFINCFIGVTIAGTDVLVNDIGVLNTGHVTLKQCDLSGDGSTGSTLWSGNSSNTTANSVRFENTVFRSGNGLACNGSTANTVTEIYFCNIDANATGLILAHRAIIKDCIFTNNPTNDISLSGSGSKGDFSYCEFETQTDTGGFGTGNIFGITSTNEYTDETTFDYHLKSGAQARGAGNSVSGITVDHDGVTRAATPDIGAFEFVAAATTASPNSLMMMGVGI